MKNIKTIAILMLALTILASCKKETAVTSDSTDPLIKITIGGGSFSKTFTNLENETNGVLNLHPNTTYNFTITATDTSGLGEMSYRIWRNGTWAISANAAPPAQSFLTQYEVVYKIDTTPYTTYFMNGHFTTPSTGNGSMPGSLHVVAQDASLPTANISNVYIRTETTSNPVGGYGWVVP